MHSIDKAYDLYLQMLALHGDVKRYAEERIELGRNKKLPSFEDLHPNTLFVSNEAIMQIESDKALNSRLTKSSLGWQRYPELIRHLYNKMSDSDYFKAYMALPTASYKDDVRLVQDFYIKTVQDDELLESVVEEQSIIWCDDIDFALLMAIRTLENCRAQQANLPLLDAYKNDDDKQFTKELFRRTVMEFDDFQAYIERFTQNWDVERIAFIDNIIMAAAMAELTKFDSIPIKVTMDEYIEISKYYSTPGSSQFINGVLDKITVSLTEDGRINKTGRGLLD
jgi:N utilization substance protein B